MAEIPSDVNKIDTPPAVVEKAANVSGSIDTKTDVLSNLAVLCSLILVHFTNLEIFDVIIGVIIAFYIIYSAFSIIKKGVLVLLDASVDDDLVLKIEVMCSRIFFGLVITIPFESRTAAIPDSLYVEDGSGSGSISSHSIRISFVCSLQ